jgi:hypothetical protein
MLSGRKVCVAIPLGAVLYSVAFAGCSPTPAPAPTTATTGGYDGATRSVGAMVASPNRCAFSFIYDDFITERSETSQSQMKPNTRDAVLRGPLHIAGAPVAILVRGAYFGDAGPIGTLLLEYGGAQTKTELSSDGKQTSYDIFSTLTGSATSGDNAVKVAITLADPVDAKKLQRVDIDSMDVSITGAFCDAAAEK